MYKDIATQIAWAYLGKPYIWGGDDPVKGFDCSGFVIELLQSVKRFPINQDTTAKGLYLMFLPSKVIEPQEGCLVFWGKTKETIYHIEYCLNSDLSIGASGGGSKTLTVDDAIKQNAYIKIRPMSARSGIFGYVDPFMKG